jgi:homoserine O-acetyltransferase/O-succinyltransferase
MLTPPPVEFFTARDFRLESGSVLPEARLAWRIEGERSAAPPDLTCTAFSRACDDLAYLSTPGGALDPAKNWIIRTEMLGNGRSTSPSTAGGSDFPAISQRDNVLLQKALLDHLGVPKLRAVIGGSMGGQQALEWVASFPTMVGSAIAIVSQCRTTWHGQLFLAAMADALRSDPAFADGRYRVQPEVGLRRMARAWAPWALSPRFFSEGLFRDFDDTAADTLAGFLAKWETRYLGKDANDLICHLGCWSRHDLTTDEGRPGDLGSLARSIATPILFLPCDTDAYFDWRDVRDEAALFPQARCTIIHSPYGHAAGFGRSAADRDAVNRAIGEFLAA